MFKIIKEKIKEELRAEIELEIMIDTLNLEKEEARKMHQDFKNAKERIAIDNFIFIMRKLKRFYVDNELAETGLLLQDKVAQERALADFRRLKKSGFLDELNTLIQPSEVRNA